jgi:membrane associated rhomboid family serine protease
MLFGSLFSCWFAPGQDSIGISGGVLGLLGFMLVLGIRFKEFFPPGFAGSFLTTLCAVGVIGLLASDYIDNAAHLGGCLAGMLAGAGFVKGRNFEVPLANSPVWRWSAHIGLGLLCVAGLATGLLMVGVL